MAFHWDLAPPAIAALLEILPFPSDRYLRGTAKALAGDALIAPCLSDGAKQDGDLKNRLIEKITSACSGSVGVYSVAPTFIAVFASVETLKDGAMLTGCWLVIVVMIIIFLFVFAGRPLYEQANTMRSFPLGRGKRFVVTYRLFISICIVVLNFCMIGILYFHKDASAQPDNISAAVHATASPKIDRLPHGQAVSQGHLVNTPPD